MTKQHILFHLACLGAAILTLFAALAAIIFILPQMPLEYRPWAWGFILWQLAMVSVIVGYGIANFRWGFITARPMWIMIVACGLTGWLIPLGIWGFMVWDEEKEYLNAWRKHVADPKRESKLKRP